MLILQDPKFITQPLGSVLPAKPEIRLLKEEDRLACIVTQISEDSALMPRGCLSKRTDGKVVYAPDYRGLSPLEAIKLNNYVLYRTPKQSWNANLIKRPDYNYSKDIFDTTDAIQPGDRAFALSVDNDRGLAFVRSLFWPGMMFFHKFNSRKHGFCYFGDGRKNMDVLFML